MANREIGSFAESHDIITTLTQCLQGVNHTPITERASDANAKKQTENVITFSDSRLTGWLIQMAAINNLRNHSYGSRRSQTH